MWGGLLFNIECNKCKMLNPSLFEPVWQWGSGESWGVVLRHRPLHASACWRGGGGGAAFSHCFNYVSCGFRTENQREHFPQKGMAIPHLLSEKGQDGSYIIPRDQDLYRRLTELSTARDEYEHATTLQRVQDTYDIRM